MRCRNKKKSTHDQMASTSRSRVIKMSQTRKERAATEDYWSMKERMRRK
jgi:hypothetical protein